MVTYPNDWVESPITQLGHFTSGDGFPLDYQGNTSGKYPFYKVSDFNNAGNEPSMKLANNYISEEVAQRLHCHIIPEGAIIFAKIGAAIYLERKHIAKYDCCVDNNMIAFSVNDNVDVHYICYVFQRLRFGEYVSVTALPSLSPKVIGKIQITIPKYKAEQTAITRTLATFDTHIDNLTALIEKKKAIRDGALHDLMSGRTRLEGFSGEWEELLTKNLKKRGYSDNRIKVAVGELVAKTKNQADSLYALNREVYSLLRYDRQGIKDENKGRETVHYIDWQNVDNNDFYVAEEVSVLCYDGKKHKRPDLVLYVNGIAFSVFELKSSCVSMGKGIRQMNHNQEQENIPNFFSTAQYLFAGNEAEGLSYGTIGTPEKYWLKWKEDENAEDKLSATIKALQGNNDNRLRDGIISLCHKERFLSLAYDFVIFDAGYKKVVRHNQYFANIAARRRILEGNPDGKGGIIWNTQGSGKSLIMVWLAKWIIENIPDSHVVIITDREELDDQIESVFINVGEKKVKRAKSCTDFRDILDNGEYTIACSLIHKAGHNAGKDADIDQYSKELVKNLPKGYKAKGNIIGFIDECHPPTPANYIVP